MSEANVKANCRLEAAQLGIYLWVNNVGAGTLDNGAFMRWGLANDSKAINAKIKSGDLIGIRKRLIVPADVGTYIGQFMSRECKDGKWVPCYDAHEMAQIRWRDLINNLGGDAKIITGPGSLT